MLKLFPARLAGNLLLIGFIALAIFDLLILVGVAPSNIVMGGAVPDASGGGSVLIIVALLVTLFFLLIIAAKMQYIKLPTLTKAVNIGIWLIFAYLILNTIGNLASGVTTENLLFAPITIILALCALRLALAK